MHLVRRRAVLPRRACPLPFAGACATHPHGLWPLSSHRELRQKLSPSTEDSSQRPVVFPSLVASLYPCESQQCRFRLKGAELGKPFLLDPRPELGALVLTSGPTLRGAGVSAGGASLSPAQQGSKEPGLGLSALRLSSSEHPGLPCPPRLSARRPCLPP